MKRILFSTLRPLLSALLVIAVLAACEQTDNPATDAPPLNITSFNIHVGSFPAFGEDAATRSIGTFDPGKSVWEVGDFLLVKLDFHPGFDGMFCTGLPEKSYFYKLTYTDLGWNIAQWNGTQYVTPIPIHCPSYQKGVMVKAIYAPAFDWTDSADLVFINPTRIKGTPATGVFTTIATEQAFLDIINNSGELVLNINFPPYNGYTRLRVATDPSVDNVILTCSGFDPVGDYPAPDFKYTAQPDAKGNAYFYGVWRQDSEMLIQLENGGVITNVLSLPSTGGMTGIKPNQSYVVDARPAP